MNTLDTLKNDIVAELQGITLAMRSALKHAANVGRLLLQVKTEAKKQKLGWILWVKDNCGFCHNTATNYIRIADNWKSLEEQHGFEEMTVTTALSLLAGPRKTSKSRNPKGKSNAPKVKGGTYLQIVPKPGYDLSTIMAVIGTMATVEEINPDRHGFWGRHGGDRCRITAPISGSSFSVNT